MRALFLGFSIVVIHAGLVAGRQTPAAPAAPATTASAAEQLTALKEEGAELYGLDCMECHMDGGMGPTLAGNSRLSNKDLVVNAILLGVSDGDMPSFAKDLTDHQIAAVSTYIRNVGDNAYGIVLESDVKRLRAASVKK